jgi:uncharacterized paraquat-inducible protein A
MSPLFLLIKSIDIGYVTVLLFIFGILISWAIDKYFGQFKEKDYKKTNTFIIFMELIAHLFLIGIITYALRNFMEIIPFPLDGVGGYDHLRLKELQGGVVLSFVILFFQHNLSDKLAYFKKRVFNEI